MLMSSGMCWCHQFLCNKEMPKNLKNGFSGKIWLMIIWLHTLWKMHFWKNHREEVKSFRVKAFLRLIQYARLHRLDRSLYSLVLLLTTLSLILSMFNQTILARVLLSKDKLPASVRKFSYWQSLNKGIGN